MSIQKVPDSMITGLSASKLTGTLPAISGASLTALNAANVCLLYTSPSPRDRQKSRMPASA